MNNNYMKADFKDVPLKIDGPYFEIQLQLQKESPELSDNPYQLDMTVKRPVGRPRKHGIFQLSLIDLVPWEQINELAQWIHEDNECSISKNFGHKNNEFNMMLGDNQDQKIIIKRQRGFKKIMACPLIHELLFNPKGHTTKKLTEQVLCSMNSRLGEQNQEKMRRRIYQFLMVMKTTGLIYSEEEQRPAIESETLRILEDCFPSYFKPVPLNRDQINENANQNNVVVESSRNGRSLKKKSRKRYNKKKALCLENFLRSKALRQKHLQWYKEKVKQKNDLANELRRFSQTLDCYERIAKASSWVIGTGKENKQQRYSIDYLVSNQNQVNSTIFGLAAIDSQCLIRGDLLICSKKKYSSQDRLYEDSEQIVKKQPIDIQPAVKQQGDESSEEWE